MMSISHHLLSQQSSLHFEWMLWVQYQWYLFPCGPSEEPSGAPPCTACTPLWQRLIHWPELGFTWIDNLIKLAAGKHHTTIPQGDCTSTTATSKLYRWPSWIVSLIPRDPKLILNTNKKKRAQIKNNWRVLLEMFYRALGGDAYHYVTAEHEFYMMLLSCKWFVYIHNVHKWWSRTVGRSEASWSLGK